MKDNTVTLYCGDSAEILAEMPKESVDLVVTSPPYDNLRSYNGKIGQWNFEKFQTIAQELYQILKTGGVIVWVINDSTINGSESGTSFRQALYFMDCGFNLHDTMIYEKNSSSFPAKRTSTRYTQIFEYMFVFSKGPIRKDILLLADKKNKCAGQTNWGKLTYYDKDKKDCRAKKIKPVPEYSLRNNIWQYTTSMNDKTGHPAVFPEALAQDHILSWSNPGDIVLDPFMGSGTTGKMAVLKDRKFIGIEIDKEYYGISEKRLSDAIAQRDKEIEALL